MASGRGVDGPDDIVLGRLAVDGDGAPKRYRPQKGVYNRRAYL